MSVGDRARAVCGRLGHLRSALIYLEKALEIESRQPHTAAKADTHLNTCAVLSQLNRHDIAMNHAHQAIMIVQATLLMHFLPNKEKKKNLGNAAHAKESVQVTKEFKDRIAVLTIAYHNLGVEQEFMKMVSKTIGRLNPRLEYSTMRQSKATAWRKSSRRGISVPGTTSLSTLPVSTSEPRVRSTSRSTRPRKRTRK